MVSRAVLRLNRVMSSSMEIDGSLLEGGGQVLRNCVAYAALLHRDISISKIRGGRDKPGLKRQHLAGLRLAENLTGAQTTGLEQESQQITFSPGGIKAGGFDVDIKSAGACTLLAQISIPIALFAPGPTTFNLKGGTNVPFSPPAEYLKHVFLPTLRKFGAENVEIDLVKPGVMPAGGGVIKLRVSPVEFLNPVELESRGETRLCTVYVTGLCTEKFEKEMRDEIGDLSWRVETRNEFNIKRSSKDKPQQVQVVFVAETDKGMFLGSSAISGGKSTGKKLVGDGFRRLVSTLDAGDGGVCVDEYLQDQVIIFMALARGVSSMRCGEITLHTKTAMHFASVMTGAVFEVQEIKQGVNLVRCTPNFRN